MVEIEVTWGSQLPSTYDCCLNNKNTHQKKEKKEKEKLIPS
jgi:hypothetical protein